MKRKAKLNAPTARMLIREWHHFMVGTNTDSSDPSSASRIREINAIKRKALAELR